MKVSYDLFNSGFKENMRDLGGLTASAIMGYIESWCAPLTLKRAAHDLDVEMKRDRSEKLDSTNLIIELERAKQRKSALINDYGFLVSEDPMKKLLETYASMHRGDSPSNYPNPQKYNFSLAPIKAIDEGMDKRPRVIDLTIVKKGLFKRNTR